jgi:hypothetical protein
MTEYAQTTESRLTMMQRVALCFAGGVLGALAVVLFSHVLFGLGISGALGVKGPVSLKKVAGYLQAALLGRAVGDSLRAVHQNRLGATLPLWSSLLLGSGDGALFLIFLPMSGAGCFGLRQGGPMFTAYLLLVNVPFGIITAVAARALIGKQP